MDSNFVTKYLQFTVTEPLCQCRSKLVGALTEYSKSKMINIENIKSLLESSPPDLKIISADKKTIKTHKLLVGLMNSFIANIFLEEELFGETVTLLIPHDSITLENAFSSSDFFHFKEVLFKQFLIIIHVRCIK